MKSVQSKQHLWRICALIPILVSVLVYCYLNNYFTPVVTLQTKFGTLQGFTGTSRDGRTFYQFNSIPYAKPPVGQLRFQPPAPAKPWVGIKDATRMTPNCLQFDIATKSFRGQEDCLFLNIFTPQDPTKPMEKLLPVIVFIHGGIFMCGGSGEMYGGRYFMDEDVIFVTINYRLGLLGFLNTGDEVVSGNMGLKDQLEALKFVKQIIRDFGGDPNRITLQGESAGGVSVHLHMLSPQSKDYFHRAISQSGSAFCPWAFTRNPREQAVRLGNQLNCPTTSSDELVKCLVALDPWELIKPQEKLADVFVDPLDMFEPSVENVTSKDLIDSAFLTQYPYELARRGKTHGVPWISGVNSHEGCYRSAWLVGEPEIIKRLNNEWDHVASNVFLLFQNDSQTFDKLRSYHFGNSSKEISTEDYEGLTHIVGDRFFSIPVRDAALLHANSTGAPTYLYYYTEKGDLSLGDFLGTMSLPSVIPRVLEVAMQIATKPIYNFLNIPVPDYGVCHGDELFQMVSLIPTSILDITHDHRHYQFSKELIKVWVKFARDGDPGDFNGVPWEKVNVLKTAENRNINKAAASFIPQYLNINAHNPQMIEEPFHSRLNFWQELALPRNLDPDRESLYNHDIMKG